MQRICIARMLGIAAHYQNKKNNTSKEHFKNNLTAMNKAKE